MPRNERPHEGEKAFQAAVLELAQWCGYRCYHTHDSRKSAPGFVDLVLAKSGRPLLMIELKRASGIVSPAQQDWQDVLQRVTGVHADVWRPADWPTIEQMLQRLTP